MPSPDDTAVPAADQPADHQIVVVGAGPAGLTAAYQLTKAGIASTILEADDIVGGISRTPARDGWRFDIGGHRFFTKVEPVEALWKEILPPEDFLTRPRLSRIFYEGKYYDYPIKPLNALRNLGLVEAVRCMASYLWIKVRPPKDQSTLEGYIVADYGWRLYNHFFKTYTEKVWGVPVSELSADWGAQRIKGMSLWSAVFDPIKARVLKTIGKKQDKAKQVTSLIDSFEYPKFGPGMMWERCAEIVTERGCTIHMQTKAVKIHHEGGRATSVIAEQADGTTVGYPCSELISTMPLPRLVQAMEPSVPEEVQTAAKGLAFRDFLTVAVVVPESAGFPDNWIYIHSPDVKVGRIQNFGSWSPYLIKEGRTCLGLEYFVFEGDELWSSSDEDLVERAKRELGVLGLVKPDQIEAGYVVRMPKAYPVYDDTYKANVEVLRDWLEANTPNVHPVGRNGMHRYNNQDHSMYTAMLTVENILGNADHDIWSVNVEADYHEVKSKADRDLASGNTAVGTGRDAPIIPRSAFGDDHPVNASTDA